MRNRSKIDDAACARQDRRKAKRWGFRWQPNRAKLVVLGAKLAVLGAKLAAWGAKLAIAGLK